MVKSPSYRFLAMAILVATVVCGTTAAALSADQGSPGRQGPWPVVVVPAGGLISIAHQTGALPAVAVLGTACTDQTLAVAGMTPGHACASDGPDNPGMTVDCRTGTDQISFRFCNPSLAPVLTVAGNYTAVAF